MRAIRNTVAIAVVAVLVALAGAIGSETPQAEGDHLKAPPSFEIDAGAHAVFVDFQTATYDLSFDRAESKASVVTTIDFYQPAAGHAVFDLVPETLTEVRLDDHPVDLRTVEDPDGVTRLRVVASPSEAGNHRLVIRSSFDDNVRTRDEGIVAGLWVNDWDDRGFLELYLPSNLEYDGYQMTFNVVVEGTARRHQVYANGVATEVGEDGQPTTRGDGLRWKVVYPDFYNASHVLFQLAPAGYFEERSYEFASDYRPFPVTIYGASVRDSTVEAVNAALTMLEETLGPWPHDSLLVSMTGPRRSMEYAGATQTTLGALEHELAHSYVGRSVAPASGNASWFDEAVVTWLIDRGAPTRDRPPRGRNPIGNVSAYFRATHQSSYGQGAQLIGHLDHLFRQRDASNTMLVCLREMVQQRKHQKLTTDEIQADIETCYGAPLTRFFDRYVYGR